MPDGKIRVTGSGFTSFNYRGKPIAFLEGLTDSGVTPQGAGDVAPGVQAITSIGDTHPSELVRGRVLSAGTLRCTIRETWNAPVWHHLAGLARAHSITDIWQILAEDPTYVTCTMIIDPPGTRRRRGKTYNNCLVSGIDDSETITVAGLSVTKDITIAYTHSTPLR